MYPGGLDGKESACNTRDPGSIPGSGRSPEEGNGNPLQYSCLENPKDGGAWWAIVHGVAKSQTWLSDFTYSPPNSPPIQAAIYHWADFPVLYSRTLLVIHFKCIFIFGRTMWHMGSKIPCAWTHVPCSGSTVNHWTPREVPKWSCSVMSDSLRPLECSPLCSSVHGIFHARIPEWVAISYSRRSSQPRDWTRSPTLWADTLLSEPQ